MLALLPLCEFGSALCFQFGIRHDPTRDDFYNMGWVERAVLHAMQSRRQLLLHAMLVNAARSVKAASFPNDSTAATTFFTAASALPCHRCVCGVRTRQFALPARTTASALAAASSRAACWRVSLSAVAGKLPACCCRSTLS